MSRAQQQLRLLSALREWTCQGQQRNMSQLVLSNSAIRAGPGGRQSVTGVTATVFGCNGFLGRYVVSRFGGNGSRVVCPHRCDHLDMQHLQPMGDLGAIVTVPDFSIRDDEMIARMVSKSNVVVNLISADRETWNYSFDEVHVDFARKLAEICAATPSVERLVHVSCLGADAAAPSRRLASKAAGEAAVRGAFPGATIMRSGPQVGIEDRFFMDMAHWRYADWGVPLIDGGYNRVQPVYVQDVAEAIWKSLEYKEAAGTTYELGGPRVFQLRELADIVCDEMREDRKHHVMPSFIAAPIARVRDAISRYVPMHMLTRDIVYTSSNVAESETDKVVARGAKTFEDLGMQPLSVVSGVVIDPVRFWRKGGYILGTNDPGSQAMLAGREAGNASSRP